MSRAAAKLSPALALAGCRLVVDDGQLVVLDADGVELERGSGSKSNCGWLMAVSEQLLIERWADGLGLQHELHFEHLQMRLWSPGDDPEAAPWRTFAAALRWLAEMAAARAAAEAQRLAAEAQRLAVAARRWLGQFAPLLGALVQGVSQPRAWVPRRAGQIVGQVGVLGQVVGGQPAAWAWTAGRGQLAAWTWAPGRGPPERAGAEAWPC